MIKAIAFTTCLFNFCFGEAQTITIGTQVWTIKNLEVSTFRNGDPILHAKTVEEWVKAGEEEKPAWCNYDNDVEMGTKYGKLYNWYAVKDSRGLAPVGYHIPTDVEWKLLSDFLGGDSIAGEKMKSTDGWDIYNRRSYKICPNCVSWSDEYQKTMVCQTCKDTRKVFGPMESLPGNGTNSSGFNGLPGGWREFDGFFYGVGERSSWWSVTEEESYGAWERQIFSRKNRVKRCGGNEEEGLSVRCVKD